MKCRVCKRDVEIIKRVHANNTRHYLARCLYCKNTYYFRPSDNLKRELCNQPWVSNKRISSKRKIDMVNQQQLF